MGAHAIEIDIVDRESYDGEESFHVYVTGLYNAEHGGPLMILGSKTMSAGIGYLYTLDVDAHVVDANGATVAVPTFEGNNYRTLAKRMAKALGVSGTCKVDDEVDGKRSATYTL